MNRVKLVTVAAVGLIVSTSAFGGAIISIDNPSTFNGGGGYGPVSIGFEVNYFGNSYSSLWVNRGGSISFNSSTTSSLPAFLDASTVKEIIAPFWSAVGNTYSVGSPTAYGNTTFDGQLAFAASWIDVAQSNGDLSLLNSFQVVLVDRSYIGEGDFDFIFNYDSMQWYDDNSSYNYSVFGYGSDRTYYGYSTSDLEFYVGFGTNGGLDSSQLPYNSMNSDVEGRYVFEVRNGVVTNPLPPFLRGVNNPFPHAPIPEPETWAMLLAGLGIVGAASKRRHHQG